MNGKQLFSLFRKYYEKLHCFSRKWEHQKNKNKNDFLQIQNELKIKVWEAFVYDHFQLIFSIILSLSLIRASDGLGSFGYLNTRCFSNLGTKLPPLDPMCTIY